MGIEMRTAAKLARTLRWQSVRARLQRKSNQRLGRSRVPAIGVREQREPQITAIFGEVDGQLALGLLAIIELAWHGCYREVTPTPPIVDAMLVLSDGTIGGLVESALLAVTDRRDLMVAAEERRSCQ